MLMPRPLQKRFLKSGKRGQISDTMTWVVATLIILAILLVFIYASYVFAKSKSIGRFAKGVEGFVNGIFSSGDSNVEADWIKAKTSFAYKINQANKVLIEKWINENEEKS